MGTGIGKGNADQLEVLETDPLGESRRERPRVLDVVAIVAAGLGEQILVLASEQFFTSPEETYASVMEHIGLPRWMPELEEFFHYRNLDVSTLKELARRWAPEVCEGFSKESSHLAMDDIKDSIEELKYYRKTILSI